MPQVKPVKVKISRAKKPKEAATPKATAKVVSQSDKQSTNADCQALLGEHQLAQQNLILQEQLNQQLDYHPFSRNYTSHCQRSSQRSRKSASTSHRIGRQ